MEITIYLKGGVPILEPNGKIVGSAVSELRKKLTLWLDDANTPYLFIDFNHVHKMDSSALGMLVNVHVIAARKGTRIGLINVGNTDQRTAYGDRFLGEPQETSTARANLSAVTYDDLVEMMTLGMTDDVEHDDSTHFIISPMVLGKAMTTAVMSNDIALPWYQNGRMVGYPTIVTTAANAAASEPEQQILFATLSEMIFGVWSDAVFVETDSDIQTGKKQIAFEMWCDNAYKHLEAISLLNGS